MSWRRARAPWRQGAPQIWNKDLTLRSSEPGPAGWWSLREVRDWRRAEEAAFPLDRPVTDSGTVQGRWTSPARKLQLQQLYYFSLSLGLREPSPWGTVDFKGISSSLGMLHSSQSSDSGLCELGQALVSLCALDVLICVHRELVSLAAKGPQTWYMDEEQARRQQRVSMKEWPLLPPKGLERSWGQSSKPSPSLQAGRTRVHSSQGTFPLSPGPLPLERAGG